MRRLSVLAILGLCSAASAHVAPGNQPPEFELPPYQAVAPGQTISFGLQAVDAESDTLAIELVARPADASYDPLTLTVKWTPKPGDAPAGRFRVRITETQRGTNVKRVFLHDFAIAVDPKANKPAPAPLGDAVELLITIHDPERLAQVNKDWPITKMLDVVKRISIADLGAPDKPIDASGFDGTSLFKGAMAAIALRHKNPRADVNAKEFDKKAFGDPAAWKIVTIRPRLDKKAQELRVVYLNVVTPEPIYLMFRFRLSRDLPEMPPDLLELSNKELTRLTYEAFFVNDQLNPRFVTDKKAHGKAISDYVSKILNYKGEQPNMGAEFMALPHEGRFGGGSARNDDGSYASGDGWAWAVLKAVWDGPKLVIKSVPIPGFTSDVRPSADGTKWATVCASKFDPDDAAHQKGWEVLCRKKLGFTDLPVVAADGTVTSSPLDATNLFVDHKLGDLVKTVDLRDPRRDLFEENGMTCSQCHVRDFATGDRRDLASRDPRLGKMPAASPRIPTTFFNIVPEETWRPFTVHFMEFQECAFKDAIARNLGVQTNLVCPLVAE